MQNQNQNQNKKHCNLCNCNVTNYVRHCKSKKHKQAISDENYFDDGFVKFHMIAYEKDKELQLLAKEQGLSVPEYLEKFGEME